MSKAPVTPTAATMPIDATLMKLFFVCWAADARERTKSGKNTPPNLRGTSRASGVSRLAAQKSETIAMGYISLRTLKTAISFPG